MSLLKTLRVAFLALLLNSEGLNSQNPPSPDALDACPGYTATNVKARGAVLTADLKMQETGCKIYGKDINTLALRVVYETDTRIHVKITDPAENRYEVPHDILHRPPASPHASPKTAAIQFNYTETPFSFSIYRSHTNEVLFSTASHPLIFAPQYLRIKTTLPDNPNIYGLGEHTNSFRLPTDNITLTLWSRDAYGIPERTNLYGNHPVYFEHRTTGTHGAFLLNSNGMDIKLTQTQDAAAALEYNVIGGVLDFYFLAGSTTDPTELARQYAEVVGTPAEVPYWSFGFHQCRFGYHDYVDVAGVISNYSAAKIPLETMWTDIDYMDRRRTFTVDPKYFPLNRVQEIVDYLHEHDQKYILMTDPAIAYLPSENYGPYHRGVSEDIWLKSPNGSATLSLVWPGVTVYPDWFHPNIQKYWNEEFQIFYNPKSGIDIDGVWIDMNEPANFCNLPCTDPFQQAIEQNLPPPRSQPPPDPNTPIFTHSSGVKKRDVHESYTINNAALVMNDLFGKTTILCAPEDSPLDDNNTPTVTNIQKRDLDLLDPPYKINNAAPGGDLSSRTAFTNSIHANDLVEYDTHNLFGTMMSTATRDALLTRRPGQRPFVITRSTFAGAGAKVGKWFGDNLSLWEHYRISIAEMLAFAGVFQIPMVGSDICGFGGDTTETLCARWATLGAFYPFMRNHNEITSISQEFYRWPTTIAAARNALDMRYRLIDYIYTAFHRAHLDGTPLIHPLWFKYPKDVNTFSIDTQFLYGPSILVSPVLDENSTTARYYLPDDIFYDFKTLAPVRGAGKEVTVENVGFADIPVHIRGGVVLPVRVRGGMTTTEVRKVDFEFVVAPGAGRGGCAEGELYVDDGVLIDQPRTTEVRMKYEGGKLSVEGRFGYEVGVEVASVKFLGVKEAPRGVKVEAKEVAGGAVVYDKTTEVLSVKVGIPLKKGFTVEYYA